MPPKVLAQSCSQLLLSASAFIFSSYIQSTSTLVLSGEALLYAFLLKNPLNCSEMMLWNQYSWSMNFAISLLQASTFFSKARILSQMAPSMLSMFISLSLLGLRLRVIQSLMAMRVARQLSTISFSSRYSSNFSPFRKVPLMMRLSASWTQRCYLLTSSMSREDYNFSPISHQIKDYSQSDWTSFRISCLASRKMEILLILKLMISSLGVWRRPSRLMSRSSTAEWQICSCCVMVEPMFLLNCCSTNSQIKLISLNYKPARTTAHPRQHRIRRMRRCQPQYLFWILNQSYLIPNSSYLPLIGLWLAMLFVKMCMMLGSIQII